MAKRTLRPEQDERSRLAIQTTQLVKRLVDHVFDRCEMSKTQVTAALGLLRKTLPDLQSTEVTGDIAHYVVHAPAVEALPEVWQQQHTPKPH